MNFEMELQYNIEIENIYKDSFNLAFICWIYLNTLDWIENSLFDSYTKTFWW